MDDWMTVWSCRSCDHINSTIFLSRAHASGWSFGQKIRVIPELPNFGIRQFSPFGQNCHNYFGAILELPNLAAEPLKIFL